MGQSSSTTNGSSTPWAPQQAPLESAFTNADNAYATDTAQGAYTGNYVAPTNANEYTGANDLFNFGSGAGTTGANSLLSTGESASTSGLNTADSAASQLESLLGANTTGNLVNEANTLSSGANVTGEVNSAMQAANQNAAQAQLPDLYAGAAATGNLNNNRTAVSQGVIQGDLAQTDANLTGSLEDQNYLTGITDALNQNNTNISGLTGLGNLGTSTGYLGMGDTSSGISGGINSGTAAETGAQTTQSLDQSNLNNTIDQYTNTQQYPYTQLQDLMSIIGGNYGSTSTGTTTQNPSPLSILGALF